MMKSSSGCLHVGGAENLVEARYLPLPPSPSGSLDASWRAAGVVPGKLELDVSRGWQYPLGKQPSRPCCLFSGHVHLGRPLADAAHFDSRFVSPRQMGGDHRHSQHRLIDQQSARCGLWTPPRSSEVRFVSAGRQRGQAEALRSCLPFTMAARVARFPSYSSQ